MYTCSPPNYKSRGCQVSQRFFCQIPGNNSFQISLDTVDTIWYHFLLKDKGMDDQFMEDRLREIESIDPYWQKFEWIKMREDDPDLYKTIIEFKKRRGDWDV